MLMVNEKRCLQQKAAWFTPSKHPAWWFIHVSCRAELLPVHHAGATERSQHMGSQPRAGQGCAMHSAQRKERGKGSAASLDEHSSQFLTVMPQHYLTALLSCLENAAGHFDHSFACKG